ncbi:MAG: S41 family peptidase [Chloroflexi bacterium]|nr:S41 family peptidase [Chloroflexota bacterium]
MHIAVTLVLSLSLLLIGFAAGAGTVWFYKPELRQVIASSAPFLLGEELAEQQSVEEYRQQKVELLWNIWDILEREYIEPEAIQRDKMIYGAAAGMVNSLNDPHTVFVEPLHAKILSEDMQGSFEGIGASVNMIDGQLTIVRPLPNSPALAAGLRAGDVILEVDGKSVEGLSLLEAVALIRGPEGSVVRLLIRREGLPTPFVVPVTRARVESPIIDSRLIEGNIAYLKLTEFNAVSDRKVHEALAGLLAQNPQGLILDLRGNPGGYLQKAVDVASEFLPQNALVLTEKERGRPIQEYRVHRSGLATDIPLVVLVNGGSASASEIVAGAIKDNGRGLLIGQRTYGKGSVQSTHQFPDDSSLRVTIARWYRPNGDNLDGEGIEPDIAVEMTPEDMQADRDPQLDRAVQYLQSGT